MLLVNSRTRTVRLNGTRNQRDGSFTGMADQSLLPRHYLGNILKVTLNPVRTEVLRAHPWSGISGFGYLKSHKSSSYVFSKYLLRGNYVPGTVLGAKDKQ